MLNALKRRRLTVIGVLLVILAGIFLLVRRSPGKLDRWRRAMEAKGEKFTLAEIAPPPSQAARDWEANFENAANRLMSGPIHPSLIVMMRPAGPGLARAAWQQTDPFQRQSSGPEVWPDFIEARKSNEPVLAEIRALLATHPTGSVYDLTQPFSQGPSVNFVARRTAVQHLMGAVIADLHRGRLDVALTNLHALVAFSRLHDEGGLLVDRMISVAIAGLGLSCTWEAMQAPGWDEARLASLQSAWEASDVLKGFHRTVEMERAYAFAAFEFTRTNKSGSPSLFATGRSSSSSFADWLKETLVFPIWRSTWSERDELLFFQVMQPLVEGFRATETNVSYQALHARWDEGRSLLDAHQSWLDRYRYSLTGAALPNWEKACLHAWKQESLRRLAVTALALRRYQLRHGRVPERLDDLAPDLLAQPPLDPMSGQPLLYQRLPDDQIDLRSVGENGRDDAGTGDDVVWPRLIPEE